MPNTYRMEHNVVGWFEIPVVDMDRARKFYETVFGLTIEVHDLNQLVMGWFPYAEGKAGAAGSLVKNDDWYKPSESMGPLIYFSAEDVQKPLDKVAAAGGKVLQPKTLIKEDVGYMGVFLDTEGNRIAVHSRQ